MTGTSSSLGRQIEVQKHSTKEMEKNILRIILTFIHFINHFMSKIPKYLFQIMKYNVWESKLARF